MRFGTERAFRRFCAKTELTFDSYTLMKGVIFLSSEKPQSSKTMDIKML